MTRELIKKYEIKLEIIRALIRVADTKGTNEGVQDLIKYEAVERFLKEMLADLKLCAPALNELLKEHATDFAVYLGGIETIVYTKEAAIEEHNIFKNQP